MKIRSLATPDHRKRCYRCGQLRKRGRSTADNRMWFCEGCIAKHDMKV